MKRFSLILTLILSFSCAHHIDEKHLTEKVTIAGTLEGSQYKNIYFAAQPKNKDYKKLAEAGFKTVINLRDKSEYKEDVESWLVQKKYKMNYVNIPFKKDMELNDSYVDEVFDAVKKYKSEGKVLLHCSSGNRVGAFLAVHFHRHHKMNKENSLETAKKLGLKKEGAIKKVERYFSK